MNLEKSVFIFALLFLGVSPSYANKEKDYVPILFLDSRAVEDGLSCTSYASESTPYDNSRNVHISSSCTTTLITEYRVTDGRYIYVIRPIVDHPKRALFTLGYSTLFEGSSVLASRAIRPGETIIEIRFHKKDPIAWVRVDVGVDKVFYKESRYRIVATMPYRKER